MDNPYQTSADVGADYDLSGHITGNPIGKGPGAAKGVTVGHTWLIIVGALVILWILGGGVFRKIRM